MASSTRIMPRGSRLPAPFNQVSGPQWLMLLVVLVGMTLAGNYLFRRLVSEDATTETAYQTGMVQRRTIESTVSATGTVSATRSVRVSFPTTGQVQEVLVRQGDQVIEGQPLATLNTFNLEVKRDQARANLGTAQSSLTRAQNDL